MHELTYKSKARKEITANEVQDILKSAEEKNRVGEISGCLVYHKGVFIQFIEGSKENVLILYEKIKNDIRHSEVELLWEGTSSERIFTSWKMTYYSPGENASTNEIKEFEKNLQLFSELSEKPTASATLFWKNVSLLLSPKNPVQTASL